MVRIVGHRGVAGYACENTLASFHKAIELKCDRVELDVWLSADNQLIVMHDSTVDRMTQGHGLIHQLTLEQIRALRMKSGDHIPTLQEVINVCKGRINMQIELKGHLTPHAINDILLEQNIDFSTILITSFDPELLLEMREVNPDLRLGLLFKKENEGIWSIAKGLRLEYMCPKGSITTPELVKRAHNADMKVYAFHVNEKEVYDRLVKFGVDDIGTDYPDRFLSFLITHDP